MSFRTVIDNEVRFSFAHNSPCPCGSNIAASACCLTPTGFRKVPAFTSPPLPKTGNSNPSCYASSLGDCSSKRTREHYISKSLLLYLNRHNALTVKGFPWIEGEQKTLSPNALTSNVLCGRHNAALSPLDEIAVRLFKAFDEGGVVGSGQQLLYLFSGHDVERWLLKILCGITYSNNLPLGDNIDLSIPQKWLDILFNNVEFSDDQGLYVCKSRGHLFEGPQGLQLQAITRQGRLSGLGLWLNGYELILSMSGFPSRIFDERSVVYRPLELYATGREFEKSIVFHWEGIADLGTISLEINEN